MKPLGIKVWAISGNPWISIVSEVFSLSDGLNSPWWSMNSCFVFVPVRSMTDWHTRTFYDVIHSFSPREDQPFFIKAFTVGTGQGSLPAVFHFLVSHFCVSLFTWILSRLRSVEIGQVPDCTAIENVCCRLMIDCDDRLKGWRRLLKLLIQRSTKCMVAELLKIAGNPEQPVLMRSFWLESFALRSFLLRSFLQGSLVNRMLMVLDPLEPFEILN